MQPTPGSPSTPLSAIRGIAGPSPRSHFLVRIVQRSISGTGEPTEQTVTEMGPGELLKMARA